MLKLKTANTIHRPKKSIIRYPVFENVSERFFIDKNSNNV